MFMGGMAGQRGLEKGGRDQDLLTPFWQTVFLVVCGAWIEGWCLALALVLGPVVIYGLFLLFCILTISWGVRKGHIRTEHTSGYVVIGILILVWVSAAAAIDIWAWIDYILPWHPFAKGLWLAWCIGMIYPAAQAYYVISVRVFDPHFPSPRKAVDQREWQRPWDRDAIEGQLSAPAPALITVQVDGQDQKGQLYRGKFIDLPPVLEWYQFIGWILDHPDEFSEPTAKRFGVKIDLKSPKPPWYGRGFRQVRDDLFTRKMAFWNDDNNHKAGITLLASALAAFRGYREQGPPSSPTPED